ncbi:MAG TPA: metallophosphoesterase [Actinomycetota bacterium]|nr:metallophosphoesterase [Actinomycetota bacterium]
MAAVRVLAVADEVVEALYGPRLASIAPGLVVACGDLPFEYLEYIVTMTNVPLVYVLGNHDPELARAPVAGQLAPLSWVTEHRTQGPSGCLSAEGRLVEAAGLTIAGLGGSIRYSRGPNQYTQGQMWRRAGALVRRRALRVGRRRPVDIVISHAAPVGAGDGPDPAHQGVEALNWLIERWSPRLLVHGHVHPYGARRTDHVVGTTKVVNAVGYRALEV